jgi:hypothetical protein
MNKNIYEILLFTKSLGLSLFLRVIPSSNFYHRYENTLYAGIRYTLVGVEVYVFQSVQRENVFVKRIHGQFD